jgi:hypothetical protein
MRPESLLFEDGLALVALGLSIMALGARIGERWRDRAGQVAGIALVLLGAYLVTEQALC